MVAVDSVEVDFVVVGGIVPDLGLVEKVLGQVVNRKHVVGLGIAVLSEFVVVCGFLLISETKTCAVAVIA